MQEIPGKSLSGQPARSDQFLVFMLLRDRLPAGGGVQE